MLGQVFLSSFGKMSPAFELSACVLSGGITVEIQSAAFDAGMADGKS